MAFIRKFKRGDNIYLAEVENQWEGGKVKQKILRYLGKEVNGQTVKRIRTDKLKVLSVKRYSDILLVHQVAKELGLDQLLGNRYKDVLILVYSHLLSKTSINKLEEWLAHTDLLDILDYKDFRSDRLYDALGELELLDFGSIEESINNKWQDIDDTKSAVVLDITDTYFNGHEATWKSRKGKDGKYSKLVQVGLVVTAKKGLPLMHSFYEGNISNIRIFQDMLTRLKAAKINGIVLDRGICSANNIDRLQSANIECILGVRKTDNIKKEFLSKNIREEIYKSENRLKLVNTTVYVKSFDYKQGQLIVVFNPHSELAQKEHAFDKQEEASENSHFGISLIYNSTKLCPQEATKKYFEKEIVERCFRQLKGHLVLRPLRVWLLNHVKAHIKICYLAYSILAYINSKVQKMKISGVEAIKQLESSYNVTILNSEDNSSWTQSVQLTNSQTKILTLFDIPSGKI